MLFGLVILFGWACSKDEPGGERMDFDRAGMLENYALNIIRPAYDELLEAVGGMEDRWLLYKQTSEEDNLIALRNFWQQAAAAWQSANAFNFGPAGEEGVRKGLIEEIGTFPVSAGKIEAFIAAGDASFNNFDRDSRGIYAIEYLLYGTTGSTADVMNDLEAANRRAYMDALVNHLKSGVERVVNEWTSYQSEFIANDGTDVGSSTSQLYNEFVRSYEAAKNFKVGLPAGKRAGQTQSEPQLVEAYYSGVSLELLKAHLASIERIYFGRRLSGVDGAGFVEYLQSVAGGPALIASTESQWQAVQTALAAVPTDRPLSELIADGDPAVDDLHTEMQKQIRFFKSDMSSLLGIAITFNSGDGD